MPDPQPTTTQGETTEAIRGVGRALLLARGQAQDMTIWGGGIFWVGAGASVSAGIPSGVGVARMCAADLAQRYGSPTSYTENQHEEALKWLKLSGHAQTELTWANAYSYFFEHHYRDPTLQRRIIEKALEKSRDQINWTHLCIGELIAKRYIHTVLTTNFDQLVLEGTVYAGVFPAVADGIESLSRIDPRPKHPQIVHLHGSRHAYRLLNSASDLRETANRRSAQSAIYSLLQQAPYMIILGYAGGEEGVMTLLIEAVRELGKKDIYWINRSGHNADLSPRASELMRIVGHSNIIGGQDSDSFMMHLMQTLKLGIPAWLDEPLAHYKTATKRIVPPDNPSIAEILKTRTQEVEVLGTYLTKHRGQRDVVEVALEEARRARLSGDVATATAAYERALSSGLRVPILTEAASAACLMGVEQPDPSYLKKAVDWYELALSKVDSSAQRLLWAGIQRGLGIALGFLGRRQPDPKLFSRAVAALESALEVFTRELHPNEWAAITNELGTVYGTWGQQTTDVSKIRQSVDAFSSMQGLYSREREAPLWAINQNNLGNALCLLGLMDNDADSIRKSVEALRPTLGIYASSDDRMEWVGAANNLANALALLGEDTKDANALQEAADLLREALMTYTKEKAPLDWAMAQNNLANTLESLSKITKDEATIRAAVDASHAALEIYTKDHDQMNWAGAQSTLGYALRTLGILTSDQSILRESLIALRSSLTTFEGGSPGYAGSIRSAINEVEAFLAQNSH